MTTICRAVRIISVARQNTGGSVAEPISRVEYTDEFIIESEQLCTTANRDTMLPDRYNIRNLRRVLTNPAHLINELRCLSQSIVIRLNNAVFKLKHGSGIDIFDEDWDNLIILDACRYDYFAQEYELGGDLHQSISGGSHSWAFMQHNFVGQTLHDTVYVTGNPHVEKLDDSTFFAVRNVLSEWDEELQTVVP